MSTFHKAFYGALRAAVIPYFATFGQYSWKVYKPKSKNYLMLANHNTNWDFCYFGITLRKQMYFVASEHIFRQGLVSKMIKFLVDPIPRKKGASAEDTIRLIKERLAEGSNVCMMAEGNRSFSGETGFISPNTAKLAKECGAGLITFRLHGGYFVNPRWSTEVRRGKLSGEIVNEYTAEELQAMTEEEVYEAICRDLYVNAYEDQGMQPAKYVCRHPAEFLETALFACPECGEFSSMKSRDDRFYCTHCGMELRLNEYGYFESTDGSEPKFKTILDWSDWQTVHLKEYLKGESDPEKPLFFDGAISLYSVRPGQGKELADQGRFTMYTDRMEIGNTVIPLDSIQKISITLMDTILFTANGQYYEIKGQKHYSALKYLIASRQLVGKEYITGGRRELVKN